MPLAAIRVHQATTALDDRERVAEAIERLGSSSRWIPLLTCHRAELYASLPAGTDVIGWATELLGPLPSGAIVEVEQPAALHLFRCAAGLDSAIPGERQILGQIRAAYERARAGRAAAASADARAMLDERSDYERARTASPEPELAALFERALHVGRSLRATTFLGRAQSSLGSLAVSAALARLPDAAAARVVVLGAGEMGKLAARALSSRIASLVVVNRDLERARPLAESLGAKALPLAALPDALATADALISAADSRGALLTAELLAPHAARGLVVVDIAVPRSVATEARAPFGDRYVTVDDLAPDQEDVPESERVACEARCADEARALLLTLRAREAGPTIARLRQRADSVRQRQLERALAKLGHLSERDRRVIESLSTALVNSLIHEPTTTLRETPERADAARELFRL